MTFLQIYGNHLIFEA